VEKVSGPAGTTEDLCRNKLRQRAWQRRNFCKAARHRARLGAQRRAASLQSTRYAHRFSPLQPPRKPQPRYNEVCQTSASPPRRHRTPLLQPPHSVQAAQMPCDTAPCRQQAHTPSKHAREKSQSKANYTCTDHTLMGQHTAIGPSSRQLGKVSCRTSQTTLHSAHVTGARDVRPSTQEAQTAKWQGATNLQPIRSPPDLLVQPNTRQDASWTQKDKECVQALG
jgi:hypothetical protein